jgi:hypothetical protein
MLEKFGSKRFEREIEDTLQRLQRAAEARYRNRVAEQP